MVTQALLRDHFCYSMHSVHLVSLKGLRDHQGTQHLCNNDVVIILVKQTTGNGIGAG